MKDTPLTAARLLALYDQVAGAEDAIPRLRRFVLDLAVRGKLVAQEASDEPAAELLQRLSARPRANNDLPINWLPAKLGQIVELQYGKGLDKKLRLDRGPVPVFGSNGIVGYTENALTARPSVIVGRKGSAGALNLCEGPSWTTDVAYFVECPSFLSLRYLFNLLASLNLDSFGKGVKPGLSRSDAYDIDVALPPLAEQRRIVGRVEELMALCDQLQAARAGERAVRDRLTTATLFRLTAPDQPPESAPQNARFALQSLPTLTTNAAQIKTLRQTILNLAVRGKLVAQDPTDEPAAELLKRISAVHPKRKNLAEHQLCVSSELAGGWSAAHLDAIASFENGDRSSNYPSGSDIKSDGVPFFSTKNLTDYRLHFSNLDFITEEKFASLRSGKLSDQDILITLRGSVGKFGLFEATSSISTGFINAQLMIIRCVEREVVPYLLRFMQSGIFSEQITRLSSGSATPQLSAGKLGEAELWLPPLAEQHRIVARVDALMALCDQLEASLTTATTTRSRLLQALLHEALGPLGQTMEGVE